MKISDFRKAMRPKKYLTRDFVVYQDPKMQAARSEMQEGGRAMTVSEKFIEANRKKQAAATEAAKKKFMEMKVTKPTPTSYDGKLDVKYSDEAQQKTVEKLIQKKFSYPKNSVEGRNIDKYLMDEFDLNAASLERITRVIKNKYELKNPKASKFYTGEKKKLRKIDETRRQKIKELQGPRINLPKETGKEFHHVMPLAGKELITDKGVAAINKKMNVELSKYNIELNRNAERIKKLSKQPDSPERRKEIEKINFSNKNIISRAGKELPSQYRGLLGYYEYDTTDLTKPRKKKALNLKKTIGGLEGKEFVFKTASPNQIKDFKKNLFKELDVDPETREILNRLNNKLSMNPFDAEGLFKDEIAKMKKIGTPAAKFIGGVLGGLIAEVGFEAAFAIPAYSRGVDFDEILGSTIFGLAGAGKTRQEKVVEESGFDPDVVKYADLVNRKKQFIADAGFVEYFGKPGGDTGYGEIFSPGEKSPLEKRLIENAQIIDKELDQLQEGSPLEQKFKQAEKKLEKRYAEKVEGSTPRKFLKETGESVLDYIKDEDQQLNKRMEELERLGFKKGGFGKIGRRSFIKLAAGLAAIIGGIRGGVKQLKTPAAKKVLTDAPTGTPDWFAPLVEKLTKEGIDISDKAATIERQTVKELKTPDGTYTLTETPDTGEIIISVDTGAGVNDFPVDFTMTPNKVTGIADDGTPITEFGEFNIIETRAEGRLVSPDGDYDIEPGEYITNNLDDAASDWHSVEKFATGKTDEIAQKKKQDGKEFIEKNPGEDIVNRYGDYDPPEPEPDYD
jgi:hypothetical protein